MAIFSCDQAALKTLQSVRPSVTPFSPCSCHRISRGILLTLHYHMHFIDNRNEEIQAKILEFSADRMQQPLHVLILGMWQFYCHIHFIVIGL